MERTSGIALMLAITMLFWIWQSSQTVFDEALPFLDISNGGFYSYREAVKENQQLNSSSIIISVSEMVALCLGVATMASMYVLYLVYSNGEAPCLQNLMFTGLVSITSAGYGMHIVCVTAQLQMSKNNQLDSLLDFVHERWSHNMFQFGIFGLLLLVIWTERPTPLNASTNCNRPQTTIKLESPAPLNASTKCNRPHTMIKPAPLVLTNASTINYGNKPHTKIKSKEPSVLASLWLKGLGPVIAGLFTAVFANRTETSGAVLAFYISILVCFVNHHKYSAHVNVVSPVSQYITLEFFVFATLVGLPTLFVHAWLM